MIDADRRRWSARDDLLAFLRRQLWTAPGTAADDRLIAAMGSLAIATSDGSIEVVDAEPLAVGIVSWSSAPEVLIRLSRRTVEPRPGPYDRVRVVVMPSRRCRAR